MNKEDENLIEMNEKLVNFLNKLLNILNNLEMNLLDENIDLDKISNKAISIKRIPIIMQKIPKDLSKIESVPLIENTIESAIQSAQEVLLNNEDKKVKKPNLLPYIKKSENYIRKNSLNKQNLSTNANKKNEKILVKKKSLLQKNKNLVPLNKEKKNENNQKEEKNVKPLSKISKIMEEENKKGQIVKEKKNSNFYEEKNKNEKKEINKEDEETTKMNYIIFEKNNIQNFVEKDKIELYFDMKKEMNLKKKEFYNEKAYYKGKITKAKNKFLSKLIDHYAEKTKVIIAHYKEDQDIYEEEEKFTKDYTFLKDNIVKISLDNLKLSFACKKLYDYSILFKSYSENNEFIEKLQEFSCKSDLINFINNQKNGLNNLFKFWYFNDFFIENFKILNKSIKNLVKEDYTYFSNDIQIFLKKTIQVEKEKCDEIDNKKQNVKNFKRFKIVNFKILEEKFEKHNIKNNENYEEIISNLNLIEVKKFIVKYLLKNMKNKFNENIENMKKKGVLLIFKKFYQFILKKNFSILCFYNKQDLLSY